jgi:hypothetical protein
MTLQYITAKRTGGCNPFKVFEELKNHDAESLARLIKRLKYEDFLQTAYWFAVASVSKASAGMRCQVCNSSQGIAVHHRTYDTHGYEHLNMRDLTVLCENCHGLFHGHLAIPPPRIKERRRGPFFVPRAGVKFEMPDGDPIVLSRDLIDHCRANGSFTNATLRAFGLKRPLLRGWVERLVGTSISRTDLQNAFEGQFLYRSGPLEYANPESDRYALLREL